MLLALLASISCNYSRRKGDAGGGDNNKAGGLAKIVSVDGDEVSLEFEGGKSLKIKKSEVDYALVGPSVFGPYCMKCHAGPGAQGGASFEKFDSAKGLAPRIIARMADGTMPPMDPKPTPAEIQAVEIWIENGLLEDSGWIKRSPTGGKPGGGPGPGDGPRKPDEPAPAPERPVRNPEIVSVSGERISVKFSDGKLKQLNISEVDYKLVGPAIVTPYCAKCHGGDNPRADIDLSNYANTSKYAEDLLFPILDSAMPPSGALLTPKEVLVLSQWISNGVPENTGWSDDSQPPPPPPAVTFTEVFEKVFKAHCVDCHVGIERFSLQTYDDILKRINPGEPAENSQVFRSVKSGSMPEDVELPEEEREELLRLLKSWIEAGARND